VGGHVEEADMGGGGISPGGLALAARRERLEEVEVEILAVDQVGLLNDDADPVGRVHLGVVFVARLRGPSVRVREAALADPGFVSLGLLPGLRDQFEGWSRICIDRLPALRPRA
jgi:predicted NUDIX family phosphoesterase